MQGSSARWLKCSRPKCNRLQCGWSGTRLLDINRLISMINQGHWVKFTEACWLVWYAYSQTSPHTK
jgi:hypothetical protein